MGDYNPTVPIGSTVANPAPAPASPTAVMQHIATKAVSGIVTFRDTKDDSVIWQLYVQGGQLNYATNVKGKAERLQCLLQRTQPDLAKLEFVDNQLEYVALCKGWQKQGLPVQGLRQLLGRLSLEALVQILSIAKATVEFNRTAKVEPVLIATAVNELPAPMLQMVSQWRRWRQHLPSLLTRLYVEPHNTEVFQSFWRQEFDRLEHKFLFNADRLPTVVRTLRQKLSVYRAAQVLDVQPQALTAWIQPFLEARLVSTFSFGQFEPLTVAPAPAATKPIAVEEIVLRPTIACIDDSKTIQRQVRGILEMSGYDVVSITEPVHALTSLVRHKPAVILMDVNMPDIDGYELCAMLRQSRLLKDVPIMMLTGREGIVDRMKARSLGVNYYLTKPFDPARLIEYVQKLVQTSSSQTP